MALSKGPPLGWGALVQEAAQTRDASARPSSSPGGFQTRPYISLPLPSEMRIRDGSLNRVSPYLLIPGHIPASFPSPPISPNTSSRDQIRQPHSGATFASLLSQKYLKFLVLAWSPGRGGILWPTVRPWD